MPRYDFQCEKCENIQEEFYHMKQEKNPICKKCGNKKMSIIISGGTDVFVSGRKTFGSWYEDNFHKDIAEGSAEEMKIDNKRLDEIRTKHSERERQRARERGYKVYEDKD